MDKIKIIKSFNEYISSINEISNTLKKDTYRDDILLFRGHSDIDQRLLPSVARKNEKMSGSMLIFENEMITKAIGKNPDVFYEDNYAINLLVKLQHFGIPTRLLDVTYNALVALYFACINGYDKDGEVFVFKITSDKGKYVRYFNDRYINIIANMYKTKDVVYPCNFKSFLEDINYKLCCLGINSEGIYVKPVEEIDTIVNSVKEPLFVSPVELSERQKRQQGAFIIFPNKIEKTNNDDEYLMYNEIAEIDKNNDIIERRLIIPKDKKSEFLKYLTNYGIEKDFLFPDSSDVICETIKDGLLNRLLIK